jgi:hypothetical protein
MTGENPHEIDPTDSFDNGPSESSEQMLQSAYDRLEMKVPGIKEILKNLSEEEREELEQDLSYVVNVDESLQK